MTKKVLYAIFISIAILFCSTICFATNEDVKATDLGNEVTTSIKNTARYVDNLVETNVTEDNKNAGDSIKNGVEGIGNDIKEGVEDLGNDIKDGARAITDEGENGNNANNTAVSGTTGNFAASDSVNDNENAGMNTSTWMWIIVAVVAIIIIAAVWYYAVQK